MLPASLIDIVCVYFGWNTFSFLTELIQAPKYNILNKKINFDTIMTDMHLLRVKLAARKQDSGTPSRGGRNESERFEVPNNVYCWIKK